MKTLYVYMFKYIVFICVLFFLIGIGGQCKAQLKVKIKYLLVDSNKCVPATRLLISTVTGASPGNIIYYWQFSDGSTSGSADPIIIFYVCGQQYAKLRVRDSVGHVATDSIGLYIVCNPVPDFSFDPTTGCPPLTVKYTNRSKQEPPATITSYRWDFCDGTSDTKSEPSHSFSYSSQCYCTTLSVTNSSGCSANITKKDIICVTAPPVAKFISNPPGSCAVPYTVNFDASQSSPTTGLTYTWTFDTSKVKPPVTRTSQTPTTSITYLSLGTYGVTLTVTDGNGCSDTTVFNDYVNLKGNNFNFSQSASSVCQGTPIIFSGVPALTDIWNFTQVGSSSVQKAFSPDTTIIFSAPGSYSVCYSVNYGGGCGASKCDTILVKPKPTASFSADNTGPVCAPSLVVNINNRSTQDNCIWSFPGGNPTGSTLYNPGQISYNSCGDYSLSLHVSNMAGCGADSTIINAVKIDCPKASFTYVSRLNNSCTPRDTFNFVADENADKTYKYLWDFDMDADPNNYVEGAANGLGGDVNTIFHVYTVAGCYRVGLRIINSQNCGDTTTRSGICIGDKPKACFTVTPHTPCIKAPVLFTDCTKAGGIPTHDDSLFVYTWDFGDGQKSALKAPKHPYMDTGKFTVQLIVCNHNCCDTLKKKDSVRVKAPLATLDVKPVDCKNPFCRTLTGHRSIVAPSPPSPVYIWVNPPGATVTSSSALDSTETICFPAGNLNYPVMLSVTDSGCVDNASATIQIRNLQPEYSANIVADCAPLKEVFTNLSTGVGFSYWRIYLEPDLTNPVFFTSGGGTTTLKHTFTTPGVYSIDYIGQDDNGCQKDFVGPLITAYGVIPVFTGTPLSGCPPLTVTFSSQTLANSVSTPDSFQWIYGDGIVSAYDTSPVTFSSHTYMKDTSYNVSLVVLDDHGCHDTLTKPNYIKVILPKPGFAVDTMVCKGANTCFTNLSTGNNLTYKWNFGDAVSSAIVQSTAMNPCHIYNNTGFYSVKLLAIDANGCRDSISRPNHIHVGTLIPDFTADTLSANCPSLYVSFKDASTGTDNCSKFRWTLANGDIPSPVDTPKHLYNLPGDYDVQLIVTNCFNCVDTVTKVKYIHVGGPTAKVTNLNPDIGCAPYTDCFKIDSSTASSMYVWGFGDGLDTTYSTSICHEYPYARNYDVFVILRDDKNCSYVRYVDTVTVVKDTAFFKADKYYLCGSGTVNFTDFSKALSPITYQWDFGDPNSGANNSSKLQNPTHFYSGIGTYIVTETGTAVPGCPGTWTDTIRVTGAPSADFTFSNFGDCANRVIQFSDSSNSTSPIVNRHWKFDDPLSGISNISYLVNPAHIFKKQGVYAVTLIDSSISGCVDSITKNVTILDMPVAYAGPDKIVCSGASTILHASGGTGYRWVPGQSLSNSTVASPVASPTVQTTYTVIVSNEKGCTGRDSVIVNVLSAFKAKYSSDTCICKGGSVQLSAKANGMYNYHYKWTPVSGLNNATISNPIAAPDSDTRYRVIVYDSLCYADTGHINVCVYPIPYLYAGPDVTINAGDPVQLHAETNVNGATFKWLPAGSLSCADCPNPLATVTVPTTYVVSVTDFNGCTSEDSVRILLLCNGASVFVPNAFAPNGSQPENHVFNISGSGIKQLKYLRIYDRWGEKIFETNSLAGGWDGTSKKQQMQTGVYVYYLDAVCQNGVQFVRKGNVTLIR